MSDPRRLAPMPLEYGSKNLEKGAVARVPGRHLRYLKATDVDVVARVNPPFPGLSAALKHGHFEDLAVEPANHSLKIPTWPVKCSSCNANRMANDACHQ